MSEEIREQIEALRKALANARATIAEQREVLENLTTPPFVYATVVALSNGISESHSRARMMKKGARVRLRKDSRFADQNTNDGTVVVTWEEDNTLERGWVEVRFSDYQVNTYRIGLPDVEDGAVDLELIADYQTAVVAMGDSMQEVVVDKGTQVEPGDTVLVHPETGAIVDRAQVQFAGSVGFLRRVVDETFAEVDYEGSVLVAFLGKFGGNVEKGDRVVLDASTSVIVRNLGSEETRFTFEGSTNVTWDDIGGLAEAKRQMIEAVELPHQNPDLFKFYQRKPLKGVLLYGPPGCGKTMLGKATASSLARIHSGDGESRGFLYIKGPEILDRYVGSAEATIRQLFVRARKHKALYGYPAVVFIDEADAILGKRGAGISSDVERTIVPMFLSEMDGLEDSGALFILTTNRPDILDPAVVRDGRIDRKIKIDRPTKESTAEIFLMAMKGVPFRGGKKSLGEMAALGRNEMFSPKRCLYEIHTNSRGVLPFTLAHILNGGMVVSAVDQATSFAMQRDLASGGKPQGLCKKDLIQAIDALEKQNRDLNHTDELADFVHDFREDVQDIRKLSVVSD